MHKPILLASRRILAVACGLLVLAPGSASGQGRGGGVPASRMGPVGVRGGAAGAVGGFAGRGELQRTTFGARGGMGNVPRSSLGIGFNGGLAGNWWGNSGWNWGGWGGGFWPAWGGWGWYPGILSYTVWPVTGLVNNNPWYSPSLYGGYGYGGVQQPVYVPQQQIYVERLVPQAAAAAPSAPPEAAPPPQPPPAAAPPVEPPRRRPAAGDDFYLNRPGGAETLKRAVDDIRRAWLNGDYNRLKDRVALDGSVRIYPSGKFAYSLPGGEFRTLTRDAMASIETTAFVLDPLREPENGSVLVAGKHTFKVTDPVTGAIQEREVFVSYRLTLKDGAWRIVAAGSSSQPIRTHED